MSATSQLRPLDSAEAVETRRCDWKEGRVATSENLLVCESCLREL